MNRIFFTILLFSTSILFSQKIIFEEDYSNFPFELQIDNSGIYSIASFDIDKGGIYFSSFTQNGIYEFRNGKFTVDSRLQQFGNDFIAKVRTNNSSLQKRSNGNLKDGRVLFKKNFLNKQTILTDRGGKISGTNGEAILISVPNRDELIIKSNLLELSNEMIFRFPSNLACADLIGIDKNGNIFVTVEKYLSEIPLKVEREVITISKTGNMLSRLLLPNIKYLYTLKDLQIDEDGNLYQLLSYTDKVKIIKWENLTLHTNEIVKYTNEYDEEIHYNNFTPTDEVNCAIPQSLEKINSGVNRTEALKIADSYVLHRYICGSSNLAPNNVTAPDGDVVRTPDWLMVGINARIPYKWGGFNTIAQFDVGLSNGKYAGDINTNGVSSYAVGVDCSGYVSRCWNLSYHASTRYMPNITTQYAGWDDLKPGDAVHKIGHVRLFVEREPNGKIKIVEATGRGWGVSYWSYSVSDLQSYTPRYYNNMENNFNASRPNLVSAKYKSENLVSLKWEYDTTGILGYRIYNSENGDNWNMILDVNDNNTNDIEITSSGAVNYFRVSSVKNDSPEYTESYWSNVMGVGFFASEKTALVIDGFQRESGSWRGAGHTFILKYGQALKSDSINFTSIMNSELQNGSFQLEEYDYVFWILGDESTADETFNYTEQAIVENYLQSGGNLFVSGSEVGWDLDYKGSSKDKSFYNNYLKANYKSDDAGKPTSASGVENTALAGCNINFGQTYDEDYPDEIETQNGSTICMKYSNGKGAGIQYKGVFGSSTKNSSLIYLAFPLETTASDESLNQIISSSILYFNSSPVNVIDENNNIQKFVLQQNYPNPFNPSTKINYTIPKIEHVTLKVYDILGNEIVTLVNRNQKGGIYSVNFEASNLSTGIYFYKITAGKFNQTHKMLLIK